MSREITFQFERDPDYRVIVANGAWGGITPRGEFKFDLFFEHVDTPEEISYMATPDGLGPETNRSPNPTPFTREALVGVVMTVENAESLGKWILEKVSQAKQRTAKNEENKG
jgi:hypothetical protein